MYNDIAIARARGRQMAVASERRVAKRVGKGGRLSMQIDPVLFHNARIQNEREYGVQNIWREEEFCRDMQRRHPEIAVQTERKMQVGSGGGVVGGGRGRLIRGLGRVTFSKRYG